MRFLFVLSICVWSFFSTPACSRPTLLELYTSEGCSSCPAAERTIKKIDKRRDVFALSFHVSYWDYIGWKDPFALDQNVTRQKYYSKLLNGGKSYTPQVVIDGVDETVGSWGWRVNMLVKDIQKEQIDVPLVVEAQEGSYQVRLPDYKKSLKADIWLVIFDPEIKMPIFSGENRGRHLEHHNVVREFKHVGKWLGKEETLLIPVEKKVKQKVAFILQAKDQGPVYGLYAE